MGQDILLKKITDAKEGLPETLLAFIDREINDENVKVKGCSEKNLSDLIKNEITYISSYKKAKLKAIIGEVGSGKTILLNKIKEKFYEFFKDNCLIFSLNLSDISVLNNEDFAKDISKSIYPQIRKYYDILKLNEYNQDQLLDYFSYDNVEALLKLKIKEKEAKKYFLNEITERNLIELLEGYLKIAFDKSLPVLFIIDELNYLIINDPDDRKILTNIILQRLLRGWIKKFTKNPLYLVLVCLKNEFARLSQLNPSFYSVAKNNVIELGKLSKKEERELIELIYQDYDGYLSKNIDLENFIDEVEKKYQDETNKEKIDYYFKACARDFVQIVATVMSKHIDINYLQESYFIYEEDARNHMKGILAEKRFNVESMPNKEYRYDGFGIDIYCEDKNQRDRIRHALGDCKSQKYNSTWFEDWDYKLMKLKEKGSYDESFDYAFTIAPDYTDPAENRLKKKGCELYRYKSDRADNLAKMSKKTKQKQKVETSRKVKRKETKSKKEPIKKIGHDFKDLTRIKLEICLFLESKNGKDDIVTLNKKFGKEKAGRLMRDLEKINKIEKVLKSYRLI